MKYLNDRVLSLKCTWARDSLRVERGNMYRFRDNYQGLKSRGLSCTSKRKYGEESTFSSKDMGRFSQGYSWFCMTARSGHEDMSLRKYSI